MKNKSSLKGKKWFFSLVLAIVFIIFVISIDLVTKHLAEINLSGQTSADFIPGFINFILVYNNGGGWNIFAGHIALLVVFSVIVIAALTCFYALRLKQCKNNSSLLLGISYGLIFGGFFGNLFDRVAFGQVRDFINFQFMKFPVFNIADISLCVGTALLLIYFIFIFEKENKTKAERKAKLNESLKNDASISENVSFKNDADNNLLQEKTFEQEEQKGNLLKEQFDKTQNKKGRREEVKNEASQSDEAKDVVGEGKEG